MNPSHVGKVELLEVVPQLLVVYIAVFGARHDERVLQVDLAVALTHVADQVVVAAHDELADLDVVLLHGDLRLDEGVGVVDDGEEDVHEDEEDEEDVGDEEDRPEEAVGLLDGVKVEVAEDRPQEGEDGLVEGVEVLDLGGNSIGNILA